MRRVTRGQVVAALLLWVLGYTTVGVLWYLLEGAWHVPIGPMVIVTALIGLAVFLANVEEVEEAGAG